MSLAAESPLPSSSSSDDFAALLDAELDAISSGSPESSDDDDFEQPRSKRRKIEATSTAAAEQEEEEEEEVIGDEEIQEEAGVFGAETMDSICPPHPGLMGGMCIRCAEKVEDDGSAIALGYIHKHLKLATKEIDRLRGNDLKMLTDQKKLILILDLDHTLLNSTRLADVTREEQYLLSPEVDTQGLIKLSHIHMLTKLRPFVHEFLKQASSICEMYVYTMAERCYALEIARILDPQKVYFDDRIISQSDSTQRHQKGLDVVLGAETVAVILDDTESVWTRHKENLISMERYHYFASSCRQFNINAKSLSESMKDEIESEGILATILDVLKRTHQMFYDPSNGLDTDFSSRDVRQVLKKIRGDVLRGCKVVFSRVFAKHLVPEDQHIWKMAEQLGATCSTEVDSSVTHIVSKDIKTDKSCWALKNEKFVVNPGWIEAAKFMWRRQKEEDYPVISSKSMKD